MSQKPQERKAAPATPPEPGEAGFPRSARISLVILAVIACGAAAWAMQDFLMPTATGVVLALALAPIVAGLERLGLPTIAASIVVIISIGAIIAGTAVAVAPGLSELVKDAPQIARTIERKARPVKEWLGAVQAATDKLDEMSKIPGGDSATQAVVPAQSSGGAVMELAPKVMGQALYAFVLALFLIAVREPYRKRIILLPSGREQRLRVARIMNESLSQVSHYLFIMTIINAGVAVAAALALTVLGVPYAVVWGVAFGIASYVPYVGPTVTIALCALTQLVAAPSIGEALVAPVALVVINFVESTFVTPWLVSRRIAVSSLGVFLTVAVFGWLSGPFAAVVAVPVLILFSAVARHVPSLEPFAILLLAENETNLDGKKTGMEKLFAAEQALSETTVERVVWWRRFIPATRNGAVDTPAVADNQAV
ncbi:MAG: AI-2E family transporter [Alphaproteobacteria bacterium]|nr:AI-2E family transporter [Alphaproteobacteria bacterium]